MAYLIGEALIKANKTLLYGGYFRLFGEIKLANQIYKNHQDFKQVLQSLGLPYYFVPKEKNISSLIASLNALEETIKSMESQSKNFILEHYQEVLKWLQSKEFKESYLDTNHPYPPLLNPNRLNKESQNPYPALSYQNIPPEVAWEINLPLPKDRVLFVYWGGHGTGNTAFKCFMRRCGVLDHYCGNSKNAQETYKDLYCRILSCSEFKQYFGYLSIRNFIDTLEGAKYYALIPNLKSINLIRDPISSIRHYITMRRINFRGELSLEDNPYEICKKLIKYEKNSNEPSLETLEFWLNFQFMCLHDTPLYERLINLKNTIYMDMSEITGKKAFETFCKLSKTFGFNPPLQKEKNFFAQRVSRYCGLLPLTLKISNLRNKIFKLHITSRLWEFDKRVYVNEYWNDRVYEHKEAIETKYTNITKNLLRDFFENKEERHIYILSDNYCDFIQDETLTTKASNYIQTLFQALDKQDEIESQKKLTEQDVLDYLKSDTHLKQHCKKVLDTHLSHIKSHRPDIVESWQYYQAFEKMCAEMN
ncbi:DUF2972 domain-containing protein [Helicobacter sp. MIT 05-5294]|uniref:DUF2972 domain-containing protein n=1 Tax=Helicobacter sp. MIT 05-5294 TaxID=1548150 RepID=UPI000AA75928|nr:DUF2972 domain-containing protein [Helicobacter sp. MIT 05-5294]TLD88682.1 DUF2972 domain-containing protein [Helicobacter sp. MIT 05-5294]